MHPVERLRSVSRWAVDDDALAAEAAEALAAFSFDPAGLVVSCRRLLAHHVGNGPLWWLCSRVLAAPERKKGIRFQRGASKPTTRRWSFAFSRCLGVRSKHARMNAGVAQAE